MAVCLSVDSTYFEDDLICVKDVGFSETWTPYLSLLFTNNTLDHLTIGTVAFKQDCSRHLQGSSGAEVLLLLNEHHACQCLRLL